MTTFTPSVSDIDLYADNTLATIAMLSDPLFQLAYPATDACPCCGDVGYTAVRNGDDDVAWRERDDAPPMNDDWFFSIGWW